MIRREALETQARKPAGLASAALPTSDPEAGS